MKVINGSWDYAYFKKAFYDQTGLNLDCYKDRQMERRIRQMMQRVKKPDFNAFYDYLVANPSILARFCHYLTINTSEFFRDKQVFACLEKEIIPELLKQHPRGLKIWSAGCSVGAEPFSVAILLQEQKALGRVRIIATDLDEKVLALAQQGCFKGRLLQKMPEVFCQRYFEKEGENYLIKEVIKGAVTFQRHNLLTDEPISGCHMIFCRNVFIYFKAATQEALLEKFSRSLNPGGILVIGLSEYISSPDQFGLGKRHHRIFQKQ